MKLLMISRWAGFLLTFIIGMAAVLLPSVNQNHLNYDLLVEGLKAIGFGLIASATTALLYELHSADALRKRMAEMAAEEAMRVSTRTFRDYIPKKVFENNHPDRLYNVFFEEVLSSSSEYMYRGDTARITTYQLAKMWSRLSKSPRKYEFMLLDPKVRESFNQRADIELRSRSGELIHGVNVTASQVQQEADRLRDDVFVSVFALWDIARNIRWHGDQVDLAFYNDVPFYRSEILSEGLFITFYIRGTFQGTFFYEKHSLLYDAFLSAFDFAFRDQRNTPRSDIGRLTENELVDLLQGIGMSTEGDNTEAVLKRLASKRDSRFHDIAKEFHRLNSSERSAA